MSIPKLRCPLGYQYLRDRKYCTLTQMFGENRTSFYAQLGLSGHDGWDFRTKTPYEYLMKKVKDGVFKLMPIALDRHEADGGKMCYAVCDGKIVWAGEANDGGIGVRFETDPFTYKGDLCKLSILYYHLESVYEKRKVGQRIKRGYIIGRCGNTGKWTTGAHLHFAVKLLKKVNGRYKAETDNGYRGAVDPLPFMTGDDTVYEYRGNQYKKGKLLTK